MEKQKTQTVMKFQETPFGLSLPTLPLNQKHLHTKYCPQ